MIRALWVIVAGMSVGLALTELQQGDFVMALHSFSLAVIAAFMVAIDRLREETDKLQKEEVEAERNLARHFMDSNSELHYLQTLDEVDEAMQRRRK